MAGRNVYGARATLREFIYLSDSKLGQFVPKPHRFARPGALRVTTPLGGLDVEPPAADSDHARLRHLRRVVKHLDRAARWFTEPDLRPGQWVRFEAPLRCVTLKGEYQHMVLFADPFADDEPGYDREAGFRLLMHGSIRHLIGHTPQSVEGPDLESFGGGASYGETFVTDAGHVVRALAVERDPTADESPDGVLPHAPAFTASEGVRALLSALHAGPGPMRTAAWMRGYARVSAQFAPGAAASGAGFRRSPCLVASPLSVEYAHDRFQQC
ncbi:SAVMC3_10250 family protein [Streptomyces sp. NBC_01142]|uniref:SAVMC3_10250 family protein n=1 Tax=Streptomyces sp. NBC_01142 TaxID=2975865 RepID=UPI002257BDC3|nr:SAVMC3_10250 family protein [Streptomyces sp. NBC_01142]MCX4825571.1 SAVMC3_10250 family protein [Streptomyces sp. NBC_01142]